MAKIGINVSADGRHSGASLRGLNATMARIAARRGVDQTDILTDYRANGIGVLLVLDRLSIEAYGPVDSANLASTAAVAIGDYARRYDTLVGAWEVGNEADLESESSWSLSQADLTTLGQTARAALPGRRLVLGGLASGQPSWLDGADLGWCDSIGLHPYLKDATPGNDVPDVNELVTVYAAYGKPLWITEWGWWGDDEERGAAEVGDMTAWAAGTGSVETFLYFCVDDAMVAPFGLYRADGTPKPAAEAFKVAAISATALPAPVPVSDIVAPAPSPADPSRIPLEVPTMPALTQCLQRIWQAVVPLPYDDTIATFGLPAYWREHLAELGSPVGQEIDDDEHDGCKLQPFALGVLRWRPDGTVERAA